LVGRIGNRLFASVALLATLAGELASTSGNEPLTTIARGVMGVGEGSLYGFALAVLARTPRPARAFGMVVFANQITSALLLTLSGWANLHYPVSGIFILMVLFLIATACFIPAVDSRPIRQKERIAPGKMGVFALLPAFLGIFLFATAFGTIWPIIASIGEARGISRNDMTSILATAGVAGIAGAGAAILLADRIGRTLPLAIGMLAMLLALLGAVRWALPVAAPAILFFWSFLVPYYLGFAAEADRAGRFVGVAGAMLPSGIAAGQANASYLLSHASHESLGLSAAAMQIGSMLWMALLSRRVRRIASRPVDIR